MSRSLMNSSAFTPSPNEFGKPPPARTPFKGGIIPFKVPHVGTSNAKPTVRGISNLKGVGPVLDVSSKNATPTGANARINFALNVTLSGQSKPDVFNGLSRGMPMFQRCTPVAMKINHKHVQAMNVSTLNLHLSTSGERKASGSKQFAREVLSNWAFIGVQTNDVSEASCDNVSSVAVAETWRGCIVIPNLWPCCETPLTIGAHCWLKLVRKQWTSPVPEITDYPIRYVDPTNLDYLKKKRKLDPVLGDEFKIVENDDRPDGFYWRFEPFVSNSPNVPVWETSRVGLDHVGAMIYIGQVIANSMDAPDSLRSEHHFKNLQEAMYPTSTTGDYLNAINRLPAVELCIGKRM